MRWAGHVEHIGGEESCIYRFLGRKTEGKRPGLRGRIILTCILKEWVGEAWSGLIRLRIGLGGGFL